jgi:hypothetical protein
VTLKQAIKEKCLNCCCGQIVEVRECTVKTCALHPFRQGKNPFRAKRVLTDEQRMVMSERMKKARGKL